MTKKMYYAAVEGFLFDRYRMVGDPVGMLAVDEAKYPEQMGQISATPPKTATTDGGKGGKATSGET